MAVVHTICTWQAKQRTEALLDYAIIDFKDTANGAVQAVLDADAQTFVRRFKSPDRIDPEALERWAASLDVDAITVKRGDAKEASPTQRRDANLAFRTAIEKFPPPHDGFYAEVRLSENTLAKGYAAILGHFFDDWLVGEKGFFLCAEMPGGKLVSNPRRHRDEARDLAGTGFTEPETPPGDETFLQELYGETTFCRMFDYAGHRVLACVPKSEFFAMRDTLVVLMGVLVFLVLAGFAAFADRIAIQSEKLKAFYATEFNLARTIQTSALPVDIPQSDNFSLAAAMTPAREVGGDFYDYFALSDTRYAFLVADVSGKGITAALFMMTAKTVLKDAILAEHDISAAIAHANNELCRNNPANMFVTVWAGILDLASGTVTFVNAGHNPPVLLGDGTLVAQRSGCMLGFMENAKFKAHTVRLAPGDTLFIYTDGVTEQCDANGELFGEARLVEVLKTAAADKAAIAPGKLDTIVRAAVSAFAAGAPVADDITVMSLVFKAPIRMPVSRRFSAVRESVEKASRFLGETLGKSATADLFVILDEIASNIVRHSRGTYFDLAIENKQSRIKLIFRDDGIAFDPLAAAEPDTTLPLEKRPIGGLGILMVRHLATSVSYAREGNENVLTIEKLFV